MHFYERISMSVTCILESFSPKYEIRGMTYHPHRRPRLSCPGFDVPYHQFDGINEYKTKLG
jgi:hypothetical protein